MGYLIRFFWALTLVAFVAGCSGYQSHYSRSEDPIYDSSDYIFSGLRTGDRVRVTLDDGRKFENKILIIDATKLVLGDALKESTPVAIEPSSITTIEKFSEGISTYTAVGLVLVVGMLAVLIVAISTVNSLE